MTFGAVRCSLVRFDVVWCGPVSLHPTTPAEAYRGTVGLFAESGYEPVADLPTGQRLMQKEL